MEEKKCLHCGTPADEQARFCISCGAALKDAGDDAVQVVQPPMIPPQYAPQQTDFSAQPSPPGAGVPQPGASAQYPYAGVPQQAYPTQIPRAGAPQHAYTAQPPYVPQHTVLPPHFCRHCGRPLQPGAAICLQCGFAVGNGTGFCPQCGQAVFAGAVMCVRCHTPLVVANQKSKVLAGLLGIFLGGLGIHNFYLGHTGRALVQLLVSILGSWMVLPPLAMLIWALVEGIQILTGSITCDANGVPLKD